MNEVITKNGEEIIVAKEFIDKIKSTEEQIKLFKEEEKKYKAALLAAMEEYGIEKIDTENVLITYVPEFERLTVDSKKLQKEYNKAYFDCLKASDVKASVRVKVRG